MIGIIICQFNFIRRSNRSRGRVPRIHRREKAIRGVEMIRKVLRKMIEVRVLKNNMLVYSARKIRANRPPMYSTLNPDTNSDSASAKSKGDRFTSAVIVHNHMINRGREPIMIGRE